MCRCHSHAKPPAREPEPIVGIHLLRKRIFMTFKDLQKVVQSQQSGPELNTSTQKTYHSGYWTRNNINRKISVQKDNVVSGISSSRHKRTGEICLSYHTKRLLYEALQNHKHIWCLKSRGIGVTTFLLRYIAWCCISGIISH